MDSRGRIRAAFDQGPTSAAYKAYLDFEDTGLAGLEGKDDLLETVLHIHRRRLEFYKEERRIHLIVMALVSLAFVILLPAVLHFESYMIPLAAAEGLLLVLLVPYIFVYRRYEEGLREMMDQEFRLEDALFSSRSSSWPS